MEPRAGDIGDFAAAAADRFERSQQGIQVRFNLGLGITQFPSRQHRPIESALIDERFGRLARNGRQVMIEDLQNSASGPTRGSSLVHHPTATASGRPTEQCG